MTYLIFNSILLGISLALDAFSVSVADAIANPELSKGKKLLISSIFGFFQTLMPLLGWLCIHTLASLLTSLERIIPYISLLLLLYLGIKMLLEKNEEEKSEKKLTIKLLLTQAVATSLDALSVGFAIAEYSFYSALLSSLIVGLVTFIICTLGVELGKRVGNRFSKVNIIGGVILIIIGIEIFITNTFF